MVYIHFFRFGFYKLELKILEIASKEKKGNENDALRRHNTDHYEYTIWVWLYTI